MSILDALTDRLVPPVPTDGPTPMVQRADAVLCGSCDTIYPGEGRTACPRCTAKLAFKVPGLRGHWPEVKR